jgi:hypothetical protein
VTVSFLNLHALLVEGLLEASGTVQGPPSSALLKPGLDPAGGSPATTAGLDTGGGRRRQPRHRFFFPHFFLTVDLGHKAYGCTCFMGHVTNDGPL